MEKLDKVKIGAVYRIAGFASSVHLKIKRRLLELGLTLGQKVRVVRKSLIGKAYLIEVRGYTLSVRKTLASFVLVRG